MSVLLAWALHATAPDLAYQLVHAILAGHQLGHALVARAVLTDGTIGFLIRCGVWALLAWALWSQPIVRKQAHEYRAAWVAAWKVEADDCDVQAYGLLFRRACEE